MICYDLCCSAGHKFEGWFGSASDYELQLQRGLISCPVCDDTGVEKLLSAPNVGRKGNQASSIATQSDLTEATGSPNSMEQSAAPAIVSNGAAMPPVMAEMIQKIAVVQQEMLKTSDWVGRNFAEEARAIHYGETATRLIHGEASPAEAQILSDEGIAVAPLLFPFVPPEAKN